MATSHDFEPLPRHIINLIEQRPECLLLTLADIALMPINVRFWG
jgi:hypothetical protein